jgi:hypothetical protein
MLKITLEFREEEEARIALDGWKYQYVLQTLEQELRRRYKYSEDEHEIRIAEELRDFLRQQLEDNQIFIE